MLIGLVTLGAWLLWPVVQSEVPRFREALVPAVERLVDWLETQYADLTGKAHPEMVNTDGTTPGESLRSVASGAWPVLSNALGAASGVLVALFAGACFAAEPNVYADGLLRLAPEPARSRLHDASRGIADTLRHWLLKRVVRLPPALTVITQSLMAVLFGVLGLVAVPLLATMIVLVRETCVRRLESTT